MALIERTALKDSILDYAERVADTEGYVFATGVLKALDYVAQAPTTDPIRAAGGCYCRACRRCNGFPGPEIEQNEVGICKLTGFAVEPDGWCKWGKLREETQE